MNVCTIVTLILSAAKLHLYNRILTQKYIIMIKPKKESQMLMYNAETLSKLK